VFIITTILKLFLSRDTYSEGKVFPVHSMKAGRRSGGVSPLILHLGTWCRWEVNITPLPLEILSNKWTLWHALYYSNFTTFMQRI